MTWPSRKTGKPGTTSPFSLFKHQATVLEDIQAERSGGKSAFLVVLPTGTGKTEILIADHAREYRAGNAAKTLVMVPTRQLKTDHAAKFASRLSDHGLPQTLSIGEDPARHDITIQTYAWMSRHYTRFDSRAFDYIAVAPTVQKVIQSSIIKKSEGPLIVSELCEKIRAGLN